jgi:hypothetical protein
MLGVEEALTLGKQTSKTSVETERSGGLPSHSPSRPYWRATRDLRTVHHAL